MTMSKDPMFTEKLVKAKIPYEAYDFVYDDPDGRGYRPLKRDEDGSIMTVNHRTDYLTIEEDGWVEAKEIFDQEGGVDVEGIGNISLVEDFGGEGQGDQYYFVIKVNDGLTIRYFYMGGYYASYSGGEYDGELYEVSPVQKTVTVYE